MKMNDSHDGLLCRYNMFDPHSQFREVQFIIIGKYKCFLNELETHTVIAITDNMVFI